MSLTAAALADIALGKGGTYSLSRDVIKHSVFDTRYFAATISDNTFFSQPLGATWRVGSKSQIETNLSDSGKLPNGQTFLIKKFCISAISFLTPANTTAVTLAQSFVNVLHSSLFEIKIAGRDFDFQIPGAAFLPSLAIHGANQTNSPVRVGDQIASGAISLDSTPIFLDQMINFSVKHSLSNPDTNIQTILNASTALLYASNSVLQVRLEGVLTRAK